VLVGQPPLNQQELLQYLRVIVDFKRTTKYETLSYVTLEALAKSAWPWNWDATAQREMLVLSNVVRLLFPPRGGEVQKTFSGGIEDMFGWHRGSSRRSLPSPQRLYTTEEKESAIHYQKSINRQAADFNAAFPESSRNHAS
jgi:hypothetical protein